MGLYFGGLGLHESLRPWRANGVQFLFKPEQPGSEDHAPVEPQQPQPQDALKPPAEHTLPPSPPISQASPEWPSPWDLYLAKARRPCQAVWTYRELGADIRAAGGNPERRALFLKIFQAVPWLKGGVTFWPVAAAEENGTLTDSHELFWKGVRHVRAQSIFCFGRSALSIMAPGLEFVHGHAVVQGLPVHILPGPEDMLPDNRESKRITWNLLLDIRE